MMGKLDEHRVRTSQKQTLDAEPRTMTSTSRPMEPMVSMLHLSENECHGLSGLARASNQTMSY